MRTWLRVIWLALVAIGADGQSKLTLSQVTVRPPGATGLYPTDDLRLDRPTAGLFIGVSEYGAAAKVPSTPAHSIAAALMQEAYFDAARESEMAQRRKAATLPEPARWTRHRGKVTALAFSPDGALLASGGEDGTVVVGPWQGSGATESLPGESAVAGLSFARDGTRLLVTFAHGRTALWDLRGRQTPLVFEWKDWLRRAELSPDDSHLLVTMATGEVWLVETRPGAKPVRLQKGNRCYPFAPSVFSPDGKWVAGWDCLQIRLWPVESPRHPRVVAKSKNSVRSLVFTPSVSRLVAAGDLGIAVWRLPGLTPQNLSAADLKVKVDQAVLSSDGRFLAALPAEGPGRILDLNTLETAGVVRRLNESSKMLALSRGGEALVGLTDGGWGWLSPRIERGMLSLILRPVSNDPVIARQMENRSKLLGFGLPPDAPTELTESLALTPDGAVVAAGYRNGEVALHPGINTAWNCSATIDRLSLALDLSLPAGDVNSDFIAEMFGSIHGTIGNARLCGTPAVARNNSGYHVGRGGPVNRKRILASLEEEITQADALLEREGQVFLVVYIAAHGELTSDGRAWILPADAVAGDRTTWIDYEGIAGPIRRFLERARATRKDPDAVRALVIFDACQRGVGANTHASPIAPAPGLVIVESTSPGQYAWQFAPEYRKNETFLGESNSGKVSHEKKPDDVKEFRTHISILPIASQFVISKLIELTAAANDGNDRITFGDWINGVTHMVPRMQSDVPEAGSEFRQDVQVLSSPNEDDWTIFHYRKREFKP